MLKLLLGGSGSGKTTLLYQRIRARAEAGEKSILLVPEQFTSSTEGRIHRELGDALSGLVESFSFTSLAEHILSAEGGSAVQTLSDAGRAVLVRRALEELQDNVHYYYRHRRSAAFCQMAAETIDELKSAGLSGRQLYELAQDCGTDSAKLSELALIFQGYETLLAGTGMDPSDRLELAASRLEAALARGELPEFLRDRAVFIDEFDTFNAPKKRLMGALLASLPTVTVALCDDGTPLVPGDMSLFSGAKQVAAQLRQLMGTVRDCFDLSTIVEYTVEAGRPDCTDAEKLAVIKEYGATRISINPQTFSDEVLENIGRKHSAQDILDCYAEARAAGHDDINMDLIAGLPGDTVEGFEKSLRQAIALAPENITVHTLTLKRASRIVIEDQKENDYADVAAMLEKCHLLAEAGYRPYYLYRQKNTLQNLENVGWCKPGHEGYYNIYIMEEVQTILSAGAGGSTKLVADGGRRMQRIFNFKYPTEYIQRFDEVLERKKGVADFYDHDLGTETSG